MTTAPGTLGIMTDTRVRPKLVVEGADHAIAFYQAVLGARLQTRHTMGEQVVFAQLELPSGDCLQLKDADGTDAAPSADGGGVILDVLCEDPDVVADRAVEHGATMIFAVDDQPYGSRQGRFRDPFGHQWIVGTPITMQDTEVQKALDRMVAGG